MSSKRRSKRELITIDDDAAADGQPVVKKEAQPIPSPEVIELQRKVTELEQANAKLEKNFQGACRMVGEAQERVKFLENLVDTKPKVVVGAKNMEREEELEKKLIYVTNQLEEERMSHRAKNDEQEKKINEMSGQLCQFEQWADQVQLIPGFAGPPKPQFPSEELDSNTMPVEIESQVADDANNTEGEGELEKNMDDVTNQLVDEGATATPSQLHDTAHPTNIFQLCRAGTPETLSAASARNQLKSMMGNFSNDSVFKNHKKLCKAGNYESLECEICDKRVVSHGVLYHFISTAHKRKVRPRGAAVSFAAFQHWVRLLQPDAAAASAAQAAAAALTPTGRWKKKKAGRIVVD